MNKVEAAQWLTDDRLGRINHDRERAGEEPLTRESAVDVIVRATSVKNAALVLARYE